MSTLRKIHATLGIALVTALAFVAGSASADSVSSPADHETIGEVTSAVELPLGARSRPCTMSGETPTGREWARLIVVALRLEEGNILVECHRERTGGEAPVGAPHCKSAEFSKDFGCTSVID